MSNSKQGSTNTNNNDTPPGGSTGNGNREDSSLSTANSSRRAPPQVPGQPHQGTATPGGKPQAHNIGRTPNARPSSGVPSTGIFLPGLDRPSATPIVQHKTPAMASRNTGMPAGTPAAARMPAGTPSPQDFATAASMLQSIKKTPAPPPPKAPPATPAVVATKRPDPSTTAPAPIANLPPSQRDPPSVNDPEEKEEEDDGQNSTAASTESGDRKPAANTADTAAATATETTANSTANPNSNPVPPGEVTIVDEPPQFDYTIPDETLDAIGKGLDLKDPSRYNHSDDQIRYHSTVSEALPWALSRLRAHKSLEEATATLIPQTQQPTGEINSKMYTMLLVALNKMKEGIQRKTEQIDGMRRSIMKVEQDPTFVYNACNIKLTLEPLPGAQEFPQLQFAEMQQDMKILVDLVRKRGTKLKYLFNKNSLIQLRAERGQILYRGLTDVVADTIIHHFWIANKHRFTSSKGPPIRPVQQLCVSAVWQTLHNLDHKTLECLDYHRPTLESTYIQEYGPPTGMASLNTADTAAVKHATGKLLETIPHITYLPIEDKRTQEALKEADRATLARLEKAQAEDVMKNVQEALQTSKATLPQNEPTLRASVKQVIREEEAKKHLPPSNSSQKRKDRRKRSKQLEQKRSSQDANLDSTTQPAQRPRSQPQVNNQAGAQAPTNGQQGNPQSTHTQSANPKTKNKKKAGHKHTKKNPPSQH